MTRAALLLATILVAAPAAAQEQWKPEGPVPRAADGKPDLSGVWWLGREPALIEGRVGSPRRGEAPPPAPGSTFASLYQPWAAAKAKMLSDKDDPALRCIPSVGGPPQTNIFQLVQTPKLVVLLQETYHGFRLIPTEPGRQHSDMQPPAYWGDSVGRWEGDTLVVDVVDFNDRNWISPQGIVSFHSDALHVIERYRRIAANALEVEKTYDDPKVLIRPWVDKKMYRLAVFDQVMEAMCTGTETASLMEAAAKENYGR
ncbi:MAG: hypothetical protein HYY76_15705 [Acidobacteria bacterium]|nr:hypothetical protein [Acidobacteriota bacterium]